jgi:hypothetical protein
MRTFFAVALASAVCLVPQTASSAVQAQVAMNVGPVSLRLPMPPGFCTPAKNELEKATKLAEADPGNVTLTTLLACKRPAAINPWSNYILIKAPTAAIGLTLPKEPTLAQLEAASRGPGAPIQDDKMNARIGDNATKAFGERIEVGGSYGAAGRDADCVYLAGPISVQKSGSAIQAHAATCMTVVKGKVIAISVYDFVNKTDYAVLKAQVRKIALSII